LKATAQRGAFAASDRRARRFVFSAGAARL